MTIEGLAGVTEMETNTAPVTVMPVEPWMEPRAAEIVVFPVPAPVASPAAFMVATELLAELQITALVRFWVLLSLYVPVAVNCWLPPFGMDGFTGVTAMETSG